jgi:hypothetical protein
MWWPEQWLGKDDTFQQQSPFFHSSVQNNLLLTISYFPGRTDLLFRQREG